MTAKSGEAPGGWRQHTRWLRPGTLGLALVLFALPFVAVSCEAPGGFGHVGPGGTTSWSGYQLATGAEPSRSTDHLLPAAESASDHIGVQPLLTIALVLLVAALVVSFVVPQVQRRRLLTFWAVAATLAATVVGSLLASRAVLALVEDQLAGRDLPDGAVPADYVSLQTGFWLFVAVLAVVLVTDLALWQSGRRQSPGSPAPPGR